MTAGPPTPSLVATLRDGLAGDRRASPRRPRPATRALAARVRTRIVRDLLPRLRTTQPLLLAAVAGPNNVGKSTLFNALVGDALSPARAQGGLTQQCLAAAHGGDGRRTGTRWRSLRATRWSSCARATGRRSPSRDRPGDSSSTSSPTFPPGLVLVDTPDFDSVVRDNRLRSEALLVTVDVLVFVVSRHTYQNAALVDVVRDAVGRGRPWVVVYNEAPDVETTRAHLDKLQQDVGAPPFARYRSRHDLEVEAGRRGLLEVEPLDGGPPLAALLGDPAAGRCAAVGGTGCGAAGYGRRLLRTLATELAALASEPDRLRSAATARTCRGGRARCAPRRAGRRAGRRLPRRAGCSQPGPPMDPPSIPRAHRGGRSRGSKAPGLASARRGPRDWRPPIRPRRPTPRSATARGSCSRRSAPRSPPGAATRPRARHWSSAVGIPTMAVLQAPGPLVEDASLREDRAQLLARCRELVAAHLPGGLEEGALQTLATLVYSVPAGTAAVVTVVTGGVGHDAVVWAGTLLTTPLMERFVDLLGSGRPHRGDPRPGPGIARRLARAGAGGAPLRSAPRPARRRGRSRGARRRRVRRGAPRSSGRARHEVVPPNQGARPPAGHVARGGGAPGPCSTRRWACRRSPASRSLLGRLADDYARTRALAARPLRIALVGSTGAGRAPSSTRWRGRCSPARAWIARPRPSRWPTPPPTPSWGRWPRWCRGWCATCPGRGAGPDRCSSTRRTSTPSPRRTPVRRWRCSTRSTRRCWSSTGARWPRPGPATPSGRSPGGGRCSAW